MVTRSHLMLQKRCVLLRPLQPLFLPRMKNYYKILHGTSPVIRLEQIKNVPTDRDVLDVVRKHTPQFILLY